MLSVLRYALLLVAAAVANAMPDCLATQVLWSTGEPQAASTRNDGTKIVWQYVSGYVDATTPHRFAAAPFRIDQASRITEIRAHYTDEDPDNGAHSEPTDVSYIVWGRLGLTAPTMIVEEGSFGPYIKGDRYSGANVDFENDYIHTHSVDFLLPAGDYYLTLYSQDTTIGWVTGGRQADTTLEQDFIWRSRSLPMSGFEPYFFPGQTDLLADSKDVYNPIFSIVGEPVPEPSPQALATTIGAMCLALRRRRSGAGGRTRTDTR
jgi:hypothetical protein